jgi:hypothetical protein
MLSDIAQAFAEKGLTEVTPGNDNAQKAAADAAIAAAAGNGGNGGNGDGGGSGEVSYLKEGKIDEAVLLSDIFGADAPYKSIADLKAAKLPDTLKEYSGLKTKISEYETKLQEKNNPFFNEQMAKMNILAKETKIDNLNFLSKLIATDFEKADAKTFLKLQMILDNPELASKEAIVDRLIDKKYDFAAIENNRDLDDEEKESEKELLQVQMDMEAAKSKTKFADLSKKAVMPKAEEVEAAAIAASEQARKGWNPVVDKIAELSLTKIKIPAGGVTVDFDVPKETLEIVKKLALDFASKSFKGELTQENAAQVIDYMTGAVKLANEAKIYKAVMKHARSMSETEWIREANNPAGFNQEKGGTNGKVKSVNEQMADFFESKI